MVAHDALLRVCARSKMLSGLTDPRPWNAWSTTCCSKDATRRTARLRDRLARAHEQIEALLDAHGFEICAAASRPVPVGATRRPRRAGRRRAGQDGGGCRHLADAGLAVRHRRKDLPWLRFNVAYSQDPELWRFLREAGRRAGRSAGIASLAALIHDACS